MRKIMITIIPRRVSYAFKNSRKKPVLEDEWSASKKTNSNEQSIIGVKNCTPPKAEMKKHMAIGVLGNIREKNNSGITQKINGYLSYKTSKRRITGYEEK